MAEALGIDIGGTTTKFALVEDTGRVRSLGSAETMAPPDPARFLERVVAYGRTMLTPAVRHIGVAVAGFLDGHRDRLVYNPNLPDLVQFPLQAKLETGFGLPVVLEVDSNSACLAEYLFGAGRGARRVLTLSVGTGLGGGLVAEGRLVRFAYECLGDVGHVIVHPAGPACSCGGRGCAEAIVSAPAIRAAAGQKDLRAAVAGAHAGDVRCRQAFEHAGNALGVALASLATVFFPDRIVIAGGASAAGDLLLNPARETFSRTAGDLARREVRIVQAELGWRATVIGAAAGVLHHE